MKQWVIRYYKSEEVYISLGRAEAETAEEAVKSFKARCPAVSEWELTADEVIEAKL